MRSNRWHVGLWRKSRFDLESLDSRVLPSTGVPSPVEFGASFDILGNPRLGEKTRIDQPLLELFENYRESFHAAATPLVIPLDKMEVTGNRVAVTITASNVTGLEPQLRAVGYQELGARPDLHFTEGTISIDMLPQLDRL